MSDKNTIFPPVSAIDTQWKYLNKKLNIKQNHAKMMVAFYYACADWSELKNCIKTNKLPKKRSRYPRRLIHHYDVQDSRKQLSNLVNGGIWFDEEKLNKFVVREGMPEYFLINKQVHKLLDHEVLELTNSFFDDSGAEDYDIDWTFSAPSFNIINHVLHNYQNNFFTNGYSRDERAGIDVYYYVEGSRQRHGLFLCELDTKFIDPRLEAPSDVMGEEWCTTQILNYIDLLVKDLREYTDTSYVSIENINNINITSVFNKDVPNAIKEPILNQIRILRIALCERYNAKVPSLDGWGRLSFEI